MANILLIDEYVEREFFLHLLRDTLIRIPIYPGDVVSR